MLSYTPLIKRSNIFPLFFNSYVHNEYVTCSILHQCAFTLITVCYCSDGFTVK